MRRLPLTRLKEAIVGYGSTPLLPVLLFRGPLRPGRASAFWKLTLAMQVAELEKSVQAIWVLRRSPDLRHLCGLHREVSWHQLNGFLSRLWACPDVCDGVPHLRDYLGELEFLVYETTPTKHFLPWQPRRRRRHPKPALPSPMPSFYPFLAEGTEQELLQSVHALVPLTVPEAIRQDLCQDLIVMALEGTPLEALAANLPIYISRAFKDAHWKYGDLSLDAPVREGDDRTLGEMLAA